MFNLNSLPVPTPAYEINFKKGWSFTQDMELVILMGYAFLEFHFILFQLSTETECGHRFVFEFFVDGMLEDQKYFLDGEWEKAQNCVWDSLLSLQPADEGLAC